MFRTMFCFVFAAVLGITLSALAQDAKRSEKAKGMHEQRATFVKADCDKSTITFKSADKSGKIVENTLPLAKDAKILGEKGEIETLRKFAENMNKEKDKSIWITEDTTDKRIVQVKDLPTK